jgi:site-specific recombinase XerD
VNRPSRNYSRACPTVLPKEANDFIYLLATTLKPGTCRHYQASLREFYRFLRKEKYSIKNLKRKHMEQWFLNLNNQHLSATSRAHHIIFVRNYLYYLYEQEKLPAHPNNLIRSADIPRRPTYLPRPLPPDVDFELQRRLAASTDPLQTGLLLMRNTGIRIGELRSLPYQCIRSDLQGSCFLKVPLGKLNNERLVPLDDKTLALVEKLQAQGVASRKFLFESARANKVQYSSFRQALKRAAQGISVSKPITSHRLRHTYATTLLTCGVSLEAIMRLLGHKDFNMTLRYADVTLNSIRKEFFDALGQTQQIYQTQFQSPPGTFDPISAISELIAWLKMPRAPANPSFKKQARLLIRRLDRSKQDLQRLIERFQ